MPLPGRRRAWRSHYATSCWLALCRQRLDAFREQRGEEVDHIVPSNHGGTGDLSNLQALCFRCNAGKRRPARGGLCVLRAGGQRPGAAGERTRSSASPMPIQVRCFQRWGSWRPCRAITRISVPCSRK